MLDRLKRPQYDNQTQMFAVLNLIPSNLTRDLTLKNRFHYRSLVSDSHEFENQSRSCLSAINEVLGGTHATIKALTFDPRPIGSGKSLKHFVIGIVDCKFVLITSEFFVLCLFSRLLSVCPSSASRSA